MKLGAQLSALAAGLAVSVNALAFVTPDPDAPVMPGFDSRSAAAPDRLAASALANAARRLETELGVGVNVTVEPIRGVPKSILPRDPGQPLTPPSSDDAEVVARRFLAAHRDLYGLSPAEVETLTLETRYRTGDRGWTHLWFQQEAGGVKVFAGRIGVNLDRQGRILNVNAGPYVAGLKAGARPAVAAGMAVILAARYIDEPFAPGEPPVPLEEGDAHAVFARGPFGSDIRADLVYFPTRAGARLGWYTVLDSGRYPAWYEQIIDARTGELLLRGNLVNYARTASAYPIDPEKTPVRQTYDLNAAAHPNSPLGWVNATAQVTDSNNVFAREDPGPPQNTVCTQPRPQGPIFNNVPPSATQDFVYPIDLTQPPDTYVPAAITNLFVHCNIYHDYLYTLGFDEPAGNFQRDNRGQGGAANDPIDAQAQDKRGCGAANNANFGTPADGSSGRMQMFIWTGGEPDRDGDLDADVIYHEHSHGLSHRLVGGPACVGACALGAGNNGNNQGNAMGEGWSDYFSGTMTDDHRLGEYSSASAFGIRNFPLGSSPWTFGDLGNIAGANICQVHADGEIWSSTLWDVRDNFIAYYGKAAGVPTIDRYVVDSLKLMAFPPSYLDARDGLVLAAGSNTVDRCLIQKGFAKRGMGAGALDPAGNECPFSQFPPPPPLNLPVTEDFTPPAGCSCVAPGAPASVTAVASAPNEITVSWPAVAGARAYFIERADETTCTTPGITFNRLGMVEAPGTSYIDRLYLQGGYGYAYRVFAMGPDGTSCLSAPVCQDASATGNCTYLPTFPGLVDAAATAGDCGVRLSWAAATTSCPLAPAITYNIYRSNSFPVPTTAPIASTTSTSFSETGLSGVRYFYLIKAEDSTTANSGPSNGGNVDIGDRFASFVPGDRVSTVVQYDFEAATDEGWTQATQTCAVNPPTGTWQRVDPIGTVQFGPSQPEDDRTPTGTLCWVTQNCPAPGCGVGAADIDNSTQVLTTPAFDCSGATACFVSYWLWYYYSDNVASVVAMVEVSNDDGASWRLLEDFEGKRPAGVFNNAWNHYEYDFAQIAGLPLTATMRLRFSAADCLATIVEMAVDDFMVEKGQVCAGCTPGVSTLVDNRLFGFRGATGQASWVLTSLEPAGQWNLHATSSKSEIPTLFSIPASEVASATVKRFDDPGDLPAGFYQAYGADFCSGQSVP